MQVDSNLQGRVSGLYEGRALAESEGGGGDCPAYDRLVKLAVERMGGVEREASSSDGEDAAAIDRASAWRDVSDV